MIAKHDEVIDVKNKFRFVAPERPWKNYFFENCTAKPMQQAVIVDGKRMYEPETVCDIAARVKEQLRDEIWQEEQRFENPHVHYLDMTPAYYEMKMDMLAEHA